MDLKKEIKLSDLFRRNGKESPNGDDPVAVEEKAPRKLFARKPKEPKEPGAPKPDKGSNGRFEADARTAPPVPQIPLMRAFDLLPKEQRRQEAERRPGIAHIAVALLAVVALAVLGALFLMTSSGLDGKKREQETLQAQLAALQVQAAENDDGSPPELETERLSRTTALATALSQRVAWDRLLRDVSLVLPSDVFLTALTASSPTPASAPAAPATATGPATHFAIAGSTNDQEDVALVLSRLAILPELADVKLVSSSRGEDGAITFSINAAVRHEVATP